MDLKFSSRLTAKSPFKTVEFEGWTILIGRSAADNDVLSLEIAEPNDFWLHCAGTPGSHVVVRNPFSLPELPENVELEVGRLAVLNSRAKGQTGVAVVIGKAGDLSKPEGGAVGEINISRHRLFKVAATPPPPKLPTPPAIVREAPQGASADYWYGKIKGHEIEQRYGLKRGILKHMIEKESKGNPLAKSPRGARGLFQIMPKSISGFDGNPLDPQQSAEFVAQLLSGLLERYDGSYAKSLAAYNWGMSNLKRHGLEKAPKETRNYLQFFRSLGIA